MILDNFKSLEAGKSAHQTEEGANHCKLNVLSNMIIHIPK